MGRERARGVATSGGYFRQTASFFKVTWVRWPVQQSWLYAAYSFILISLIASLIMTFIVGERMFDVMHPDTSHDRGRVSRIVIRLTDALATGTFILGLFLFLQFLEANL